MSTRILIVDDDPATADLLTLLLQSYSFDALPVHSGEEAVQILREQAFELVLLDLMMPVMDGRQVCRAVRTYSTIPILIYSALSDPNLIAGALDAGADDYLVKPTPSEVLVAHVRTLIRRSTGSLRSGGTQDPQTWVAKKTALPS